MGALNRLVAFQAVNEASVTPETAKRILGLSPAAAPVAAAASSGGPGGAGGPDEFGAFLADVTVTVGKAVEAWRARVTEAMLRWEGEGYRTQRLEALLKQEAPAAVDAAITEFAHDVERLKALESEVAQFDPEAAGHSVFRDPERMGEAEQAAARVREGRARAPRQEVQPARVGWEERPRQDAPAQRHRARAGAEAGCGRGLPLDPGVHRRADRGDRRQPRGLVAGPLPSRHGAAARRHSSDRRQGADPGGVLQPLQPAAGPGPPAGVHRADAAQHARRPRGADRVAARRRARGRAHGTGSRREADRARAAAHATGHQRRAGADRLPRRPACRLG